jgi:hypothetical protein
VKEKNKYREVFDAVPRELRDNYDDNVYLHGWGSVEGALLSYEEWKKSNEFYLRFAPISFMCAMASSIVLAMVIRDRNMLGWAVVWVMIAGLASVLISLHRANRTVPHISKAESVLDTFVCDVKKLFDYGRIDKERLTAPVLELMLIDRARLMLDTERRANNIRYSFEVSDEALSDFLIAQKQTREDFECKWQAAQLFGVTKRTKKSIFDQASADLAKDC